MQAQGNTMTKVYHKWTAVGDAVRMLQEQLLFSFPAYYMVHVGYYPIMEGFLVVKSRVVK